MCVIAIAEFARLTEEQVEQMWDQNPRGGGAAWREMEGDTPVVKWKKGLLLDEMQKLNRTLPLPYVLHFRIPSGGTSNSWLACHPFAINEDASYSFEGTTRGSVLFHNGFWTGWKEKIQQIALNGYVHVPGGPWSDSRGLAWTAHHLGFGMLELIDEKVVVFGPNEDEIDIYGTWQDVKVFDAEGQERKMLVSNKTWEKTTYIAPTNTGNRATFDAAQRALTAPNTETDAKAGGTSQEETFRAGHTTVEAQVVEGQGTSGGHREERVQATVEGPGKAVLEAIACIKCGKASYAGMHLHGFKHCWQCWSGLQNRIETDLVGMCGTCKVSFAGARRRDNDEWICNACYETNGSPKVYFGMRRSEEGE